MTIQPFLNSRYLCKFSTKIEHSLKKNLEHLCFDFKTQNTSELVFSASTKIIIIITTPNELATSKNALEKTQRKCPWLLKQLFSFNNGLTYFLFFFFFQFVCPLLGFHQVLIRGTLGKTQQPGSAQEKLNNQQEIDPNP